ncbi:MAG: hypothetical protein IJ105_02380 [Bacilli bacterium]|nr:hypothetical protein [Bacilli bacterium]
MKRRNIVLIIGIITILMSMSIFTYVTNYIYTQKEEKEEIKGKENKLYHSQGYNEIRELIYPVGSIYMSVEDDTVAKVQERFGGEWEVFAAGRTIVAMGNNGTTNYTTVEATGGAESQSYTPAAKDGKVNNTTLTAAQTGIREHTHSFTQPTITVDSKTLTGRVSFHGGENASIISSASGIVSIYGSGANSYRTPNDLTNHTGAKSYGAFDINATHNHTAKASGGAVTKVTAANATSAHNHSFTGTEATISHMQPYITVYMYKRVS